MYMVDNKHSRKADQLTVACEDSGMHGDAHHKPHHLFATYVCVTYIRTIVQSEQASSSIQTNSVASWFLSNSVILICSQ